MSCKSLKFNKSAYVLLTYFFAHPPVLYDNVALNMIKMGIKTDDDKVVVTVDFIHGDVHTDMCMYGCTCIYMHACMFL